jgi:hypothetical protein
MSAGGACEFCALIWGIFLFGGCSYLVFAQGVSPWWFLAAFGLFGCWSCKMWTGE